MASESKKVCAGLVFGQQRRSIPKELELVSLEYVPAVDLLAVALASHSLLDLARHFLRAAKVIRVDLDSYRKNKHAFRFISAHCKQLATVVCAGTGTDASSWDGWDNKGYSPAERWLRSLLRLNRPSIRRVDFPTDQLCQPKTRSTLVRCPLVEEFAIPRGIWHHTYEKEVAVIHRHLRPSLYSQLRSLSLYCDDEVMPVLDFDFPHLTCVRLSNVNYGALEKLRLVQFQRLESLWLDFALEDVDFKEMYTEMVAFEKALTEMSQLTDLTLCQWDIDSEETGWKDEDREKWRALKWELPKLRRFALLSDPHDLENDSPHAHAFDNWKEHEQPGLPSTIPFVHSTQLRSFTVSNLDSVDMKLVVYLLCFCRQLEDVCIRSHDSTLARDTAQYVVLSSQLSQLLKDMVWAPRSAMFLKSFEFTPPGLPATFLKSVTSQTCSKLAIRLPITASTSDVAAVMRSHPLLESLAIVAWTLVESEEVSEDKSPSSATASTEPVATESVAETKTDSKVSGLPILAPVTSAPVLPATPPAPLTLHTLLSLHLEIADDSCFAGLSFPNLTKLTLRSASVRLSSINVALRCCPAVQVLFISEINAPDWKPTRTYPVTDLSVNPPTVVCQDPECVSALFAAFSRCKYISVEAPLTESSMDAFVKLAEEGRAHRELETICVAMKSGLPGYLDERLFDACPDLSYVGEYDSSGTFKSSREKPDDDDDDD